MGNDIIRLCDIQTVHCFQILRMCIFMMGSVHAVVFRLQTRTVRVRQLQYKMCGLHALSWGLAFHGEAVEQRFDSSWKRLRGLTQWGQNCQHLCMLVGTPLQTYNKDAMQVIVCTVLVTPTLSWYPS